jgi:hypothetical protein
MNPSDSVEAELYKVVDEAIGAVLPTLSAPERVQVVERFIAAGLRAVRSPLDDIRDAARDTVEAKRHLAEARSRLAKSTDPAMPPVIVDPEWTPLDEALQAHAERLLSTPGVVGFGLGTRRRGGIDVGEPCVTVYVQRKRTPRSLARGRIEPVPAYLTSPGGVDVPVDVLQVGLLRRHVVCGTSVGHSAVGNENDWATIGAVVRDRATGREVVLTAMHLTGLSSFPPGPSLSFSAPDRSRPGAFPLGQLLQGTMRGVDAAKISVVPPASVQPFIRSIGPINGTRVLSHPGDRDTPVQLFGARSGYLRGTIDTPRSYLPEFGLGEVILVAVPTRRGDSGAAVVDMAGRVLGLVVGELTGQPHLRVVSPIGPILTALNCEL